MQARLGPRPLPLHLGTALMTWASSESAWRLLKQGSPSSNPAAGAPESLAALLPEIAALEAKAGAGQFEQALQREIRRRQIRLADGVMAYQRNDVQRTLIDPPAVWREGNTRLLDYGTTNRAARRRGTRAVLVVPSLINRWEVLDLTAEKSLLRAMAAQGCGPISSIGERPTTRSAASTRRPMWRASSGRLRFVAKRARRAPAVLGYCMGGTLTVALAARKPRRVAGLALMAAPWDFHADRTGHAFLLSTGPLLAEVADKVGELPVDILQTLFWSLDPWLSVKKFGRFLGLDPSSEHAKEFVLLEDWLNGGAPLAGPTARECLVGWYGNNVPGSNNWVVGGRRIVPSKIKVPSLVMIPSGDRIVPPLSAAALADPKKGLKNATRHRPAARPYRHGGERPRPRAVLDASDRVAAQPSDPAIPCRHRLGPSTGGCRRSGWRCSRSRVFAHTHVEIANEAARGTPMTYGAALAIQVSSHLVVAALLPAIYWLHRRWPIPHHRAQPRDPCRGGRAVQHRPYAGHGGAAAPVVRRHPRHAAQLSAHPRPAGLRVRQGHHRLRAVERGFGGAASLPGAPGPARSRRKPVTPVPEPPAGPLPERFAVRRKGREIMVEVADIDWIEASGNYAVLHVGDETFEIRSSLTKLEGELDPKRFVRVHKSHLVNIARVVEVTPWVNGDWRIRLQGGAEVNLSRRYRQRFEALAPGQGLTGRPAAAAGRPTEPAGRHKTTRNQRLAE